MHYLVTGGCGRLGKNIVKQLYQAGHQVTVFDNLSTSGRQGITDLQKDCNDDIAFFSVEMASKEQLKDAFFKAQDGGMFQQRIDIPALRQKGLEVVGRGRFDAVIHCAGMSEYKGNKHSILTAFESNVISTRYLLDEMEEHRIFNLVLRSSVCVYGQSFEVVNELSPRQSITTYGNFKSESEKDIEFRALNQPEWRAAIIRHDHSLPYEKAAQGYVSALDFISNNKGIEIFNLGMETQKNIVSKKAKVLLDWKG
jgi:UDP-glucose 4-epimerase